MSSLTPAPWAIVEPGEAKKPKKVSKHQVAEPSSWPWLPNQEKGILQRHPWCPHCGQVKATGAQRALDLGGITNLLSRLDKELQLQGYPKITEAQRRLIVKRLQSLEADDSFSFSRDSQFHLIAEVVGHYIGKPMEVVGSYLALVG